MEDLPGFEYPAAKPPTGTGQINCNSHMRRIVGCNQMGFLLLALTINFPLDDKAIGREAFRHGSPACSFSRSASLRPPLPTRPAGARQASTLATRPGSQYGRRRWQPMTTRAWMTVRDAIDSCAMTWSICSVCRAFTCTIRPSGPTRSKQEIGQTPLRLLSFPDCLGNPAPSDEP